MHKISIINKERQDIIIDKVKFIEFLLIILISLI